MLCYKDRSYCGREDCKNFKHCEDSAHTAIQEKEKNTDKFCRDVLPICIADLSTRCIRKEF